MSVQYRKLTVEESDIWSKAKQIINIVREQYVS